LLLLEAARVSLGGYIELRYGEVGTLRPNIIFYILRTKMLEVPIALRAD
jgi:hypothetical protein